MLLALPVLAGCGITDTGPSAAGGPATGGAAAAARNTMRVYFVAPHGIWPVTRPAPARPGPQAALDALLDGPSRDERARGLATVLPRGQHRVRARPARGAVDLYLPWLVAELDRAAVNQLVCTAATAPGIPGGRAPVDVVVRVHESGIGGNPWDVTCDETGAAAPVSPGRNR